MPISMKVGHEEFLLRVCGVLINKGKILLHRTKSEKGWVLPGGRAEINEESYQTVVREFKEELNLDVSVQRLLGIIENFNAYGNENLHEFGIYYLMECKEELVINDKEFIGNEEDIKLIFKWIDINEIKGMNIYPRSLKGLIQNINLDNGIKHLINNDLE